MGYFRYTQIHLDLEAHKRLFNNLSPPLLLELKLYLYAELLTCCEFFAGVPNGVVKSLVTKLSLEVYSAGDFIVLKHEPATKMFFILRGICEVVLELDQSPVCSFYKGQYFGEMALYTSVQNARRTAWVRSASYCQLAQLERSQFQDILDEFPDQKQALSTQIGEALEDLSTQIGVTVEPHVPPAWERVSKSNESDSGSVPLGMPTAPEKNRYTPSPPPEPVTDPPPPPDDPPGPQPTDNRKSVREPLGGSNLLGDLSHHFDDEDDNESSNHTGDRCSNHTGEKTQDQITLDGKSQDQIDGTSETLAENISKDLDQSQGATAGEDEAMPHANENVCESETDNNGSQSLGVDHRSSVKSVSFPPSPPEASDHRGSLRNDQEIEMVKRTSSVRSSGRRSSLTEAIKSLAKPTRGSMEARGDGDIGPMSPLAQAVGKILPTDGSGKIAAAVPRKSDQPAFPPDQVSRRDVVSSARARVPDGAALLKELSQALHTRAEGCKEATASSCVLEAVAASISALATAASFEQPTYKAPKLSPLPGISRSPMIEAPSRAAPPAALLARFRAFRGAHAATASC
eukprot:gnl/MRDRNA2_/MRDRNA2_216058_c0_seq1.p1 gnl/MRDRNA2_/MRDRNA2_216058_c0~~gnl/MRDRNA2_/MRDRNA2_216058_c0_seq1.p1  ORF type:complete len:573 (-),score=80.66 gnl/MRDRNA2_/MRDRNA2_216058_c0_seq1:111-1829(-)